MYSFMLSTSGCARFFDEWGVILALLAILFIMRGLLRFYLSSKIMCLLFSIGTIVLTALVWNDMDGERIAMFGPLIDYTTLSTLMYSFGPEVFVEDVEYQLEYHEGFFSSFVTIEPHRTGGILVYLLLCAAGTFVIVNLVGYQSKMPGFFLIIPCICLLISVISLIRYFRA